jgi:hypothetical protein
MALSTISRVILGGLGPIGLAACAFGYQSVYEGDVRFEHCYRLDEEKLTPLAEKQACWAEWNRRYTYGQTRDRISYALARQRELGMPHAPNGEQGHPLLDVPKPTNASPQPTTAFAPPPQIMVGTFDGGADGAAKAAPLRFVAATAGQADAPGSACAGVCASERDACGHRCQADACFVACDDRYRSCMRSCF